MTTTSIIEVWRTEILPKTKHMFKLLLCELLLVLVVVSYDTYAKIAPMRRCHHITISGIFSAPQAQGKEGIGLR
jgi:hypothetical protein